MKLQGTDQQAQFERVVKERDQLREALRALFVTRSPHTLTQAKIALHCAGVKDVNRSTLGDC